MCYNLPEMDMRKIPAALIVFMLIITILASCKSEEEKVADEYINMSNYILKRASDAELSFFMSNDDRLDIENMISFAEYRMEHASSIEEIHKIGFQSVYVTFYGSIFLFGEDERGEFISDLEFRYPEITHRLLNAR